MTTANEKRQDDEMISSAEMWAAYKIDAEPMTVAVLRQWLAEEAEAADWAEYPDPSEIAFVFEEGEDTREAPRG